MHSSRGSSWLRDKNQTHICCVSCITGGFFITESPGKPSILEKDIKIENIHTSNCRSTSNCKAHNNNHEVRSWSNTIIVGDFNTSLSSTDGSFRQKINKETQTLNDKLDQMDLTDIYRTFHPNSSQVHTKHSLGLIICWATRTALVNLTKLKSYWASFLNTRLWV